MAIEIAEVKRLKDLTGVGLTDAKKALEEAAGDFDKALEAMRKKGLTKAEKKGEREAREGVVEAYVHSDRIGVIVEVNCETDFLARSDGFREFAHDIALHIAAAAPEYVTEEDVDDERRQAELRIYEQEAADKPENVRAKIAEGKLRKWYESVVLLSQPHVNGDRYDGKTIGQLLDEMRAKTGENVIIRRFARFAVGQ